MNQYLAVKRVFPNLSIISPTVVENETKVQQRRGNQANTDHLIGHRYHLATHH